MDGRNYVLLVYFGLSLGVPHRLINGKKAGLLLLCGEHELNVLVGQLLVDGREGLELVVGSQGVLGVKVDLEELRAVEAHAGALAWKK